MLAGVTRVDHTRWTVSPSGTVFQPFLDQSLHRPIRGRGYLLSFVLHAVLALLIWLAWGRVEPGEPAIPVLKQVAVSLRPQHPHRAPSLVGPEAPVPAAERPRRAGSSTSPSRGARAPLVPVAFAPVPQLLAAAPTVIEDERDDEAGAPDDGVASGDAQSGGSGTTGGPPGEGGNAGSRPGRRRPIELFGRVVGGGRRQVIGPQGLPYASLKEATELRTYDVFPPLPAAQWAGDRPYAIVLDVCVSGEGQVSDVALVKPASRIFDPVVLEAVRTWRYKPRLVDGHARAFCHVVAIKYEQL